MSFLFEIDFKAFGISLIPPCPYCGYFGMDIFR
jgi:hypothetical protein